MHSSGRLQPVIANAEIVVTVAVRSKSGVSWVNAGLRRVEFNDGTHLQIAYAANPSADVKIFRDAVDELMRKAAVLKNDPEQQVAQFHRVKTLMKQFTDQDTAAERWRRNVLDVRNSYTFYGKELDEGDITIYTYRNTATNSGGE